MELMERGDELMELMERGDELMERGDELMERGDESMERGDELMELMERGELSLLVEITFMCKQRRRLLSCLGDKVASAKFSQLISPREGRRSGSDNLFFNQFRGDMSGESEVAGSSECGLFSGISHNVCSMYVTFVTFRYKFIHSFFTSFLASFCFKF